MRFSKTARTLSAIAVAAVGSFSATAASAAPTAIQLDQGLLDQLTADFVTDESVFFSDANVFQVDRSQLILDEGDNSLEVFLISENTGLRSQLTFTGGSYTDEVVFDEISVPDVIQSGNGFRFSSGLNAGDSLDFTLISNMRSDYLFGTDFNADGLQHVVAFEYVDSLGEDWLILGLEDLYGELGATGIDPATGLQNEASDRDFNDVVIAVRGASIDNQSVPEPGMMLGLGAVAAVGALRRRKSAA